MATKKRRAQVDLAPDKVLWIEAIKRSCKRLGKRVPTTPQIVDTILEAGLAEYDHAVTKP